MKNTQIDQRNLNHIDLKFITILNYKYPDPYDLDLLNQWEE